MPRRKPRPEKKKILLVDDNLLTLKILRKILTDSGYAVFPAKSGGEALVLAKRRRPDLLVLDIVLPDTNGIQLALCLRENPELKDVPVIFLSSLYEEDVRKMGFPFPKTRFLRKPLNAAHLLEEITASL